MPGTNFIDGILSAPQDDSILISIHHGCALYVCEDHPKFYTTEIREVFEHILSHTPGIEKIHVACDDAFEDSWCKQIDIRCMFLQYMSSYNYKPSDGLLTEYDMFAPCMKKGKCHGTRYRKRRTQIHMASCDFCGRY